MSGGLFWSTAPKHLKDTIEEDNPLPSTLLLARCSTVAGKEREVPRVTAQTLSVISSSASEEELDPQFIQSLLKTHRFIIAKI